MRVDVEFFIDGHVLQHKLHAAEPQQHATLDNKLPIAQPIVFVAVLFVFVFLGLCLIQNFSF
jgi:hypothetical protein